MRDVYFSIILEYIINTVDIKQVDSLGYWPQLAPGYWN